MTSFFKKLFGKSETTTSSESQTLKQPEVSIQVEFKTEKKSNTISPPEKNKSYDISEIKKKSTVLKDKEGFLSSINFVKDFIEQTNIEFNELVSLLKKIVPYMKKEKIISDEEIIKFINSTVDKFEEKHKIENLTVIADLLSRANNKFGLEYLESKLGAFETDKNKTLEYFDALILLSDFYLADKQGDKAFRTIQRATLLVTNFSDKFDYLWKQKIISEKCARICLKGQKKPQYADYLHYEIVAFILEIARDAIYFPHLSGFFHRKELFYNADWGFQENEDFDNALEDLKITKHRKDLLNDIYQFTFNELPLKMGIPTEYFNDTILEPLDNLSEDFDNNYPKWRQVMEASEIFNARPFNEIGLVHDFVAKVVKKYYDTENPKGN
jgi:hypothetical protein